MSGQRRPRSPTGAVRGIGVTAWWAVVGAILLGSCAPYVGRRAALDEDAREARFLSLLASREGCARMAELEASLWVRTASGEALPGVRVGLALASPDAFRLRAESAFGAALDLAARGDSLTAYLPGGRLGMEMDAVRDSLGFQHPGGLGLRLWTATWSPPREAWTEPAYRDTLRVLAWAEGADSVRLEIASDGLPRRVTLRGPGTRELVAEYAGWGHWEGVAWPSRLALADAEGRVKITCVVHRLRCRDRRDPGRLTVRLPEDARRLSRDELLRLLERVSAL